MEGVHAIRTIIRPLEHDLAEFAMLWRSTVLMRLAVRNLMLISTAFMVLVWQVFGMSRGFLCDCGGQVEITAADHCHGPHGDACHESTETACTESGHHGEPGETRQHPPLKEDLVAHSLPPKISLPSVSFDLVLPDPNYLQASVCLMTPNFGAAVQGFRWPDTGPPKDPWTIRLARTIALRV